MIFQNPLAWIGLIAIAIPLIAHLLARRPARREPFPTLRFLPAATLKPVRRGSPRDWPLLLIRVGTVGAAVLALTQPLWLSAARERELGDQIARAIIIDASRSMERRTAGGEPVIAAARREAQRIATESTRARVEETAAPASLIAGSVNWLATQPMRREVVVISDFQPSAITDSDLNRIPDHVGRKLVHLVGIGDVAASGTSDSTVPAIRLLTSPDERRDAEAARAAVLATGTGTSIRRDRPSAVMFPSFIDRDLWLRQSTSLTKPWMFETAARVQDDAVLRAALARADRDASEAIQFVAGPIDGTESLIVVLNEKPHTLLAAATMSALMRALSDQPGISELQPSLRTVAELRALERLPATADVDGRSVHGDESDGRWLWSAALILLLVETVMRRSRRAAAEVQHARVA